MRNRLGAGCVTCVWLRLPALLIFFACVGCGNQVEPARGGAQQVALYHCGVQNLTYEGMAWEVENEPFDLTNAPDTFTGFGSFARNGDRLTFTDRAGATLTFTPYDGTQDPSVCG